MTSLWQFKRFEARIPLFKSLDCPLALAAAGMDQRFTRYPPVINHNLGWCNYHIKVIIMIGLTHSGLVTQYGAMDLDVHWFWLWLVAWQHQAIFWTKEDLLSIEPSTTNYSEIWINVYGCGLFFLFFLGNAFEIVIMKLIKGLFENIH